MPDKEENMFFYAISSGGYVLAYLKGLFADFTWGSMRNRLLFLWPLWSSLKLLVDNFGPRSYTIKSTLLNHIPDGSMDSPFKIGEQTL